MGGKGQRTALDLWDMETARIVVVSGSPAQVPGVGRGDGAAADLVAATVQALGETGPVEIVCERSTHTYTAHTGSFAAWGAPEVTVSGGNHLPELIARYLVGECPVYNVRETILPLNPAVTTVLVLDGSIGLTLKAPGYLLEDAPWAHEWCLSVLAGTAQPTDVEHLVSAGVGEPHLWLELAGLHVVSSSIVAVDTSLGVGRYVAALAVAL